MDILPEEVVQEQHVVIVVDADMVIVMVAVEAVKVMVVTLLQVMVIAGGAQQKLFGQYFVMAQCMENEFQQLSFAHILDHPYVHDLVDLQEAVEQKYYQMQMAVLQEHHHVIVYDVNLQWEKQKGLVLQAQDVHVDDPTEMRYESQVVY